MASLISHAVASLGIAAPFYKPEIPKRVWLLGAVCSAIPDLDVLGFQAGIPYASFWGHRGFTHSLLFAALLAILAVLATSPRAIPAINRLTLWLYLFLATASHGLLDAMTDGGLGVAFFSPFNNHRYFLPWRPIHVSPIGLSRFFSHRGLFVLPSELLYIWLPSALLLTVAVLFRQRAARPPTST
jgi:inner membrane protein